MPGDWTASLQQRKLVPQTGTDRLTKNSPVCQPYNKINVTKTRSDKQGSGHYERAKCEEGAATAIPGQQHTARHQRRTRQATENVYNKGKNLISLDLIKMSLLIFCMRKNTLRVRERRWYGVGSCVKKCLDDWVNPITWTHPAAPLF